MKKILVKTKMIAESENKAEMIIKAISFIISEEGKNNIRVGKWTGIWDGMQWNSRFLYILPEIKDKYNNFIQKEFGVKFDI